MKLPRRVRLQPQNRIDIDTMDCPEFMWDGTMSGWDAVHMKAMLVALKHFKLIILQRVAINEKMDLGTEYRIFSYGLDKVKRGY